MKKVILLLSLGLFLAMNPSGAASLRLPAAVGDHMVLQRNTDCLVWGWADPGAKVSLSPDWVADAKKAGREDASRSRYQATAGKDGRWEMRVSTPDAGGPYKMHFQCGKDTITVSDILIGEVWICGGQSNMRDPVMGYPSQPVIGAREAILRAPAYQRRIHLLKINEDTTQVVQKDMKKSRWTQADGQNVARFSCIGYLFARRLADALDVPIGVIDHSWGGSRIEPWMPLSSIERLKDQVPEAAYKKMLALREKGRSPKQIAGCYNSRVVPILGYTARGFLWYQGCSNRQDRHYDLLQAEMVRKWREDWGDKGNKMPFYFVTIAPYGPTKPEKTLRPFFVETQLRSLDLIPNSAAAVTETLGEQKCIHPRYKAEVADQLYCYALERCYGIKTGMGCGYPYPERFEFKDGKAIVWLSNTTGGMGSDFAVKEVRGFELAGEDRVFYPATAVYTVKPRNKGVVVSCPEVPNPVAVRYGFHDWHEGNLATSLGVPAPCFRSDDWPE